MFEFMITLRMRIELISTMQFDTSLITNHSLRFKLFKEKSVWFWQMLKFTEVASTFLQFNVATLLAFSIEIFINFALGYETHISW